MLSLSHDVVTDIVQGIAKRDAKNRKGVECSMLLVVAMRFDLQG
jgi:hypothetical protein